MTVMVGKLTSIGGEPFGGEGHAVNIFSRVTRTSTAEDAVILQLIDRIDMPGVEDGGDGTFTTADMDPGPIRVELEGSSRHGEGWDINLPEPDPEDPRPWSLGSLIGLQVDWDPVVVGRAEAAAREATRQAVAAEGHAGVAAEHREHMDTVVYDVMTNAAGMVRDEVKDDADRAESQAGVATEQAGVAAGHAEQAGEDRAQTAEDRRQTGEDRAQTGEYREAAEGWAGQSKDAATLAITAAATVTQYVGDGFPEGKVTAPVGSIYTDRQATAGAVRWIKTTGTGNTGWEVEWGDTGWRNIAAEVTNDWAAESMVVRRIGSMVDFRVSRLDATNASGNTFLYMPQGFRPGPVEKLALFIKHVLTHGSSAQMSTGDTTGINNDIFRSSVTTRFSTGSLSITYFTSDAFPTTLPGTPS